MKDKDIEKRQGSLDFYAHEFWEYTKTDEFQRDLAERKEHVHFFQTQLPGRLDVLSEADIEEIVNRLWAHRMWGNKAYVAQKIVEENSLEKLRSNLKMLYESEEDPEKAYARFVSNVKRWGPASVTEMLTYLYPHRCGIWNRQARDGLSVLGFTDTVNLKKYVLSADEYRKYNRMLQSITKTLEEAGVPDVDLLMVDFFLYNVAQSRKGKTRDEVEKTPEGNTEEPLDGFDHNEIRDIIAGIGANLGFDTGTEVRIAHGAQVDVVWRAKIANLGMVTYVFEVHRSGSIDSLILNLQKAFSAPTVQKVVAVSDQRQLTKIEAECGGLPAQFKRALRYWDVSNVVQVADMLQQVMDSIAELGLLEGTVPGRGF